MTAIAFDTLKFARALREKARLTPEQAEGFAEAITDALHDDLATKSDLLALQADVQGVKADLKVEIAAVRSELKTDLAAVRSELGSEIAAVRSELKTDLAAVRSELGSEIAAVRSGLGSEIATVRSEIEIAKRDIKIWFGSVMVVAVGVILAAIRYLPAGHP